MMRWDKLRENGSPNAILLNMLLAALSLFANGFGVYLTIQANIGVGPWDVLNIGVSRTLGILYGSASIAISLCILLLDILMREPIGIAMFIDAVVVGKAVDFFNWIHAVPSCKSLWSGIPLMLLGLVILGYTQYLYMAAALGCGPRDTLLVGLAKRLNRRRPGRDRNADLRLWRRADHAGGLPDGALRRHRDPASAAAGFSRRFLRQEDGQMPALSDGSGL